MLYDVGHKYLFKKSPAHLNNNNYEVIQIFVFSYSFLFEILENTQWFIEKYRLEEIKNMGKTDYHGDSFINVVGDIICNVIGILFAKNIKNNYLKFGIFITSIIYITIVEDTYWTTFFSVLFDAF